MQFLNKEISIKNKSNLFLWLIVFIIIIFTNTYFSIFESFENGARDGVVYFTISDTAPYFVQKYPDNAPYFLQDLPSHKSWRFFAPFLIGIFSKITNVDIYLVYQASSFLILFHLIYILDKKIFNSSSNTNFIFVLCVIFNPFFFRYYLSLSLLINDLLFIYATLYLVIFLKTHKKKFFLIGLVLACFVRQESIFIVPALLLCKYLYKNKSIFSDKLIFYSIILILIIFSLNFYYSLNTSTSGTGDGYSLRKRLALFFGNYTLTQSIEFIIFFFIPFFFPFTIFMINSKNSKNKILKNINNENFIFLLILSILIVIPGLLGGPSITGKNIARLTNLAIIPITFMVYLSIGDIKITNKFLLLFIFFGILSLQHPTYSVSNLFTFLT